MKTRVSLQYFVNDCSVKGFFSRGNLPGIMVSFFTERNTAVYIDLFGIEYIPQEVLNKAK